MGKVTNAQTLFLPINTWIAPSCHTGVNMFRISQKRRNAGDLADKETTYRHVNCKQADSRQHHSLVKLLSGRGHVQPEIRDQHFKTKGLKHFHASFALEEIHCWLHFLHMERKHWVYTVLTGCLCGGFRQASASWFRWQTSLKLLHFQNPPPKKEGEKEKKLAPEQKRVWRWIQELTYKSQLAPALDNKLSKTGRATSWP